MSCSHCKGLEILADFSLLTLPGNHYVRPKDCLFVTRMSPYYFVTLAIFATTALTATLPIRATLPDSAAISLTTGPPTTNVNATALDAGSPAFQCLPRGSGYTTSPGYSECAGAIRALPSFPQIAYFGNASPEPFQLPQITRYSNCEVLINTRKTTFTSIESSWTEIGLAAVELNDACQKTRAAPGLGSGLTYAGANNNIVISLRTSPGH